MNISHLNVGIIHSLIGKNDGVSIVIDQTVHAMINDMGIELGSIFFLAAHTSPRFNAETNDIFWHKNDIHKTILKYFSEGPPEGFDELIHEKACYARDIIKQFVRKNSIDLIIAHNTSHPYNFITAVGLGYFIEELRDQGIIWPKVMVWWHDSYFERAQFSNPNKVIKKYLKYLPGVEIDGIAFINKTQPDLARKLFRSLHYTNIEKFFTNRTIVVPNTSSIDWNWEHRDWENGELVAPLLDNYNDTFLRDVGLTDEIEKRNFTIEDTLILLQHTRIVPRKKIETALDFAIRLEQRFLKDGMKKCIALLISGHSGDEQVEYKKMLSDYYDTLLKQNPKSNVVLIYGEDRILSHRDIIVDKKYYNFYEIPAIVSHYGGIGTYFSEVEGFGNNLLEMVSFGLPVVINKYDVFRSDIEHLGFHFPAIEKGILTEELVNDAYKILTNYHTRNEIVLHNLKVLQQKLDHKIIAELLKPLIIKMFTRILNLD
ncbi:MAG: glycosyltransferase [Bacteroidales bacterium]|jgi:glycosyltransferase involved in cell wall biosynthesis